MLGIVFTRLRFHSGVIMVSFWFHFGVILVAWGVIWRPGAPQGTPQGSRVEKVMKKLVRGSFVGPPLGPLLEHKLVTNRKKMVVKTVLKTLCEKCRTRGSRGPPQTMKTMVLQRRNHYFQIPTSTPKINGNCLQWVPLWDPFGWFWGPLGNFWG